MTGEFSHIFLVVTMLLRSNVNKGFRICNGPYNFSFVSEAIVTAVDIHRGKYSNRVEQCGPHIAIYSSITNKMQRYTVAFITINALQVSGGSSAHH